MVLKTHEKNYTLGKKRLLQREFLHTCIDILCCPVERQLSIIFNHVDIVFNDNGVFSIPLNSYICEIASTTYVAPQI